MTDLTGPQKARAALAAARKPPPSPAAAALAQIRTVIAGVELLSDQHLNPDVRERLVRNLCRLLHEVHDELARPEAS